MEKCVKEPWNYTSQGALVSVPYGNGIKRHSWGLCPLSHGVLRVFIKSQLLARLNETRKAGNSSEGTLSLSWGTQEQTANDN